MGNTNENKLAWESMSVNILTQHNKNVFACLQNINHKTLQCT